MTAFIKNIIAGANDYHDYEVGQGIVLQAYGPDAGGMGFGAFEISGEPAFFTYRGLQWTSAILVSRLLHLLLAVGLNFSKKSALVRTRLRAESNAG